LKIIGGIKQWIFRRLTFLRPLYFPHLGALSGATFRLFIRRYSYSDEYDSSNRRDKSFEKRAKYAVHAEKYMLYFLSKGYLFQEFIYPQIYHKFAIKFIQNIF